MLLPENYKHQNPLAEFFGYHFIRFFLNMREWILRVFFCFGVVGNKMNISVSRFYGENRCHWENERWNGVMKRI